MFKINKSLDLNKLYEQQAKGKLLKKKLNFPLIAQTKYDGNSVVVEIRNGRATYYTSGSLKYTHTDDGAECFEWALDGYYMCERIAGKGKLGDRVRCNLRGPKTNQTSSWHNYIVFDYLSIDDYTAGHTHKPYETRYFDLLNSGVNADSIVRFNIIDSHEQLDKLLKDVVNDGYEGLMLYQPDFKWKDTKSRTVDLVKYKGRRSADLLCIGIKDGTGKYEGLIGSLLLEDSEGRICNVGSGLNDSDRSKAFSYFVDKVIEIEFEQIIDTYIQPTFIQIRDDKTEGDID